MPKRNSIFQKRFQQVIYIILFYLQYSFLHCPSHLPMNRLPRIHTWANNSHLKKKPSLGLLFLYSSPDAHTTFVLLPHQNHLKTTVPLTVYTPPRTYCLTLQPSPFLTTPLELPLVKISSKQSASLPSSSREQCSAWHGTELTTPPFGKHLLFAGSITSHFPGFSPTSLAVPFRFLYRFFFFSWTFRYWGGSRLKVGLLCICPFFFWRTLSSLIAWTTASADDYAMFISIPEHFLSSKHVCNCLFDIFTWWLGISN